MYTLKFSLKDFRFAITIYLILESSIFQILPQRIITLSNETESNICVNKVLQQFQLLLQINFTDIKLYKMKEIKEDSTSEGKNMVAEQFLVGTRIDLAGHKGTVKYVGDVSNTEGLWLGIDWDDPQRGKHNGTYKGIRYFQASYPTSGSFVRPGKVSRGISIVEAIEKRYGLVSDPNAGLDLETMIQVQREIKAKLFEVVGAEKINKFQSDFHNLRVVLLRDFPVNCAGPPMALLRLSPNIEELDLSKTLIMDWETVAEITQQLKSLKILNLSENRLEVSENVQSTSFTKLEHIILGKLLYNWFQVLKCSEYFLNIQVLQVQYNRITTLEPPSGIIFSKLNLIDLEGNPLQSWDEVNKLGYIKSLETLNVTSCGIKEVHFPNSELTASETSLFKNLKNLILTGNEIADWNSISELDKLQGFCDLRFRDNPVLANETLETNHQLIIARIKKLQIVNGQVILPEERKGAEIDYLKRFGTSWLKLKTAEDKSSFHKLHPSYQRLVDKYGAPEENELRKPPTSLKSQLIQIEIFSPEKSFSKKVPYNMSIQKLSGLIQRLFNTGSTMPRLSCVHAERKDGLEVPLDDYLKDLNFYSVENGDKISVRW